MATDRPRLPDNTAEAAQAYTDAAARTSNTAEVRFLEARRSAVAPPGSERWNVASP